MNKRVVFIFMVPLFLIPLSIYVLNTITKNEIRLQLEQVAVAEGMTIRSLMEVSGKHLGDEGEDQLKTFLDSLFDNELILYIGLMKNTGRATGNPDANEMVYLLSRFEGYFPVVEGQEEFKVMDSPAGKIFNISGHFKDSINRDYQLHIGFDYEFITQLESALTRNFYMVAALFSLIILFITLLIFWLDKKFFRKELELERERQEKERFKELALLTSEIAHEIKNPLNSIYLSFNALENFLAGNPDAIFYKDAIKQEIKRVSGIIESYSHLSSEIQPKLETIELEQLMEEFRWMLEEELKQKKIRLLINGDAGLEVTTDGNLLKQVLLNLVVNAAEAGAAQVEIQYRREGERFLLEVRDNGSGIHLEKAAEIFKPYVSTKLKGMGLGLYIVMKIVKRLSGSIDVDSNRGDGTLFKIRLPLKYREQ